MRWLVASLACAVFVTSNCMAHARGTAQLHFTQSVDDARCPDEADLHRLVAAQLGYDPFEKSAAMRVDVSIERRASRLRGRVKIWREGRVAGERELDAAKDCEALATALALTISVAIDPMSAARDPHAMPPPSATTPPSTEVTRGTAQKTEVPDDVVVPSTEAAKAPASSRPLFRFTSAPMVSVGIAPAVAPGISASVGGRWTYVAVALEGRLDLPAPSEPRLTNRRPGARTARCLARRRE